MVKNDENSAVLLIHNAPIDNNLPISPQTEYCRTEKRTFVSEGCLLGFGNIIGNIYSYTNIRNGDIIRNLCPIKGKEETNSNAGSKLLTYHMDQAFHNIPPDFIALICLRGDENAFTHLSNTQEVLLELSKEDLEFLSQPLFIINKTVMYERSCELEQLPVIRGSQIFCRVMERNI